MHITCPQCGHRFSRLQRYKLSTKHAKPCPKCQTSLLKNGRAEYFINVGLLFVLLLPQLSLGLISIAEHKYNILANDAIELPLCLFVTLLPLIVGIVLIIKGFKLAHLEVAENHGTDS